MASSKHTLPSHEATNKNEYSNPNKKARVSLSVANLPDLPACFNTLDDDCLGNVLDFVGKKCYSAFGRVNKRCHEMFCSKGYPKETYLYGYGPLQLIQQQQDTLLYYNQKIFKGVFHYNRRDILDWILTGYYNLKDLCDDAIKESRLDILHQVFQRANERQLECLRKWNNGFDFCYTAALYGKLECLKLLRENECDWSRLVWIYAKRNGHEHILEYLRDNDYPTEWQN